MLVFRALAMASVALVCGSLISYAETEFVGLLSEVVPWTTAPVASHGLSLRPLPAGVPITVPQFDGRTVKYGLITLGNATGAEIVVVVVDDDVPVVLVDANNDRDLSNDLGAVSRRREALNLYSWYVTVRVKYAVGERVVWALYPLRIMGLRQYNGEWEFSYTGYGHRRGLIELKGETLPIALMELGTTNGCYDDLSRVLVAIDADQDGELNLLYNSPDLFFPSEEPLQVGENLYELTSISPDGSRIALRYIGQAPPRPVIAPGQPAVDFEAVTRSNRRIRLSDWRGKVVLLYLEQLVPSCLACEQPEDDSLRRLEALLKLAPRWSDAILLIVDTTPEPALWAEVEDGKNVVVVWAPAVARLWRTGIGLFIIDRQGIIRAMDQGLWRT